MKFFLVGGFLGSGKTTAIVNACKLLSEKNITVAVITNDQGEQQVDNYFVRCFSSSVAGISNGCFCCKFEELVGNMRSLIEENKPEIIFAESVGSCTDLIATVVKPLQKAYPDLDIIVSIFVDSMLLSSFLEGRTDILKKGVKYIFDKQMEEADILIAGKTDMLPPDRLPIIKNALVSLFAGKTILYQNSLQEEDIETWLSVINGHQQPLTRQSLELSYPLYGEGESQLAWFDKGVLLKTNRGNAVEISKKIMTEIERNILEDKLIIGHLKFFLETDQYQIKMSFTTSSRASFDELPDHPANELNMIINARVQTEPENLSVLIETAIVKVTGDYDCMIVTKQTSSFKPGYPMPTYRIADD